MKALTPQEYADEVWGGSVSASKLLNKFAIEKKCEGYYDSCIESGMNGGEAALFSGIYTEQLRKEQASEQ